MAYIAKTNGGPNVLELRLGSLADIPEADRANWRTVAEVRPSFDGVFKVPTAPTLTVNGDGSQVNLIYSVTEPHAAWTRLQLKQYAAGVRWSRQQGGMTLPDGTRIATDDASQAKCHQAFSILEKGWATTINFKALTGWIDLDLAAMTLVVQAVAAHIQGCFAAEKALAEAIDAGTVTTKAGVDGWSWP